MARVVLFQTIPEEILLQVAKKKTPREVWESFKLRYLRVDIVQKVRLHMLKSDFSALRMNEKEYIDDFAGKLSGMISKYISLKATLEHNVLEKTN